MALQGAPRNMDQGSALPPPGPGPGGIDFSLVDPKATQYARSNPEEFNQSLVDSIGQADPRLVYELRTSLAGMNLPAEVVDALLTMVDLLMQDPANYAQNRQMFVDEGVPEEILPPNFDPTFLSGLQMALSETKRQPEVPRFARGGIVELKPIAKAMAQMGRNGDTMLAHITPREARMLRLMGGSGTTNPMTGLPEFFIDKAFKAVRKAVTGTVKSVAKAVGSVVKGAVDVVKSIAKPVVNVVKKIAQNPIGKIALTVAAVYFMGPAGLNVAGTLGMTGATALGVNTALASTAVNLASGMSLKESLKGGAISGLTAGAVSSIFPSTLPAAYQTAPTPLAAPVSAADYGMSVDSIDAAAGEAARAAAEGAPTVAPGIPVSGGAGPTSLGAVEVEDILGGLRTEAPTVQLSAQGVSPVSVQAPQVAPVTPTVPSAFNDALAGNIPTVDTSLGTGGFGNAIPTASEAASNLTAAGFAPGTAANIAGETMAGVGATPTAISQTPSLLDRGIGAIKSGYNTVMDYVSPSRIQEAGVQGQYDAYNQALAATGDATLAREAFKAAAPGLLATYGPAAALGTAALAASGAFTPKQPPPPGIVDQEYMREGSGPGQDIGIGGVNTVYAPGQGMGYGTTSFYNTASGYNPATGMFNAPQFQVRRPEEYLDLSFLNQRYAKGGIASLNKPRTYPRKTGAINGPGTGTSDSIPALLSDGEFVFTAKAVRGAGGGSRRVGAKRMYAMMKALERKSNG